jgi:hypothetical protein
MSYPILSPLGILLPKFIKHTSCSINGYIKSTTNKYCSISSAEDCNAAQEYREYLTPAVGLTIGVGTAIIFIETVSNSEPFQKSFETTISSILLGSIGIISSYIDYTDCN